MGGLRWTSSAPSRKDVERSLQAAQHLAHVRQGTSLRASLAGMDGKNFAQVAVVVRVHKKNRCDLGPRFYCSGRQGTPRPQPIGRPPTAPNAHSCARHLACGGAGAGWVQTSSLSLHASNTWAEVRTKRPA